MSALTATNLGVRINGTQLLDNISLDVDRGAWLSIIGPNGAGKSTLLRALSGVLRSSGSVQIAGSAIGETNPRARAKLVSWVPQAPTIPAGMTVVDYVLLGRTPHLHPLASPSSHDLQLVSEVLTDLDLNALASRTVETLSGGERQRTVIGRALAQDAPILLLDEPTTSLDLGHQQEVLRLLDRLRADHKRTIITTMHDLTLAGQFADRLVLMAEGAIVAEGSALDVLTEDNISRHYHADVEVTYRHDTVLVVPRISSRSGATAEDPNEEDVHDN